MRKYISGIYMWESPSGKMYIGQTKNLSFRKKQFLSKSNEYCKGKRKTAYGYKWSYAA